MQSDSPGHVGLTESVECRTVTWRQAESWRRYRCWRARCTSRRTVRPIVAPYLPGGPMRILSALVVVMLAAGCFGPASHVDSNASLYVGGVAQRQNGEGDVAATLQLIRHPDALQAIGDALTIVGSLGLACITGNDSLCHPYAQATAAADGSYTFGPI